jgi:excisionase family DNA binding protein
VTTPDLLTPQEAADYLRLPVRQLQQWRYLHKGPAYVKAGHAVRYRRTDLDVWVLANRIEPTDAA